MATVTEEGATVRTTCLPGNTTATHEAMTTTTTIATMIEVVVVGTTMTGTTGMTGVITTTATTTRATRLPTARESGAEAQPGMRTGTEGGKSGQLGVWQGT